MLSCSLFGIGVGSLYLWGRCCSLVVFWSGYRVFVVIEIDAVSMYPFGTDVG